VVNLGQAILRRLVDRERPVLDHRTGRVILEVAELAASAAAVAAFSLTPVWFFSWS
jgi:hypothetical protein